MIIHIASAQLSKTKKIYLANSTLSLQGKGLIGTRVGNCFGGLS